MTSACSHHLVFYLLSFFLCKAIPFFPLYNTYSIYISYELHIKGHVFNKIKVKFTLVFRRNKNARRILLGESAKKCVLAKHLI